VEAGALINDALPLVIALMMGAVGMGLALGDFTALAARPAAAAAGLVGMFVAFPLLALGIAAASPMSAELKVGLVLLASSPSASTSTVFTYAARGDTALAIALTTVSKVIPVLTIPLWVSLASLAFAGERTTVSLSYADTSESLALTVLLPTLAGMALRRAWPAATARLRPHVSRAGVAALVLLIGAIVYRERQSLGGMFLSAGFPALALCVTGMLGAYVAAAWLRLPEGQRTALTIETGMQSGGTSIAVAAGVLGSPAMAIPAAVYSLIMYIAAGAFVVTRRKSTNQTPLTSGSLP